MSIGNLQHVNDNMVRTWLRDNVPSDNLLMQDLEFSSDEIHLARVLTTSYWAEESPMNSTSLNDRSIYFVLMGICGQLLKMAANRYRRNALPMNAGGVTVDDQAKHREYEEAGSRMWAEFAGWVARTKAMANMNMGWGSV